MRLTKLIQYIRATLRRWLRDEVRLHFITTVKNTFIVAVQLPAKCDVCSGVGKHFPLMSGFWNKLFD